MPTVIERLNTAMTGNGATASVNTQTDNLFNVSTSLQSLVSNPPAALGNLTASFGQIGLPEFPLPTDFITRLDSIRSLVPTDASGAIGGVLGSISQLETEFGGAIAGQLDKA